MSATKTPDSPLPTNPPVTIREFTPGMGESRTEEWPLGTVEEIEAKYDTMKSEALAGNNTQSISFRNAQGRASLVARFGRSDTGEEQGDDITIIEELYAIDVIKDIAEAPYYATVTDEQVAWVRYCVEQRLSNAQITSESQRLGHAAGMEWASWSALMKSLRYHILHGVDSFFETGFILRESNYCARSASVKASFTNINAVVTAPSLSAKINNIIDSLPSGEWLYRPPQAEHLGRGNWRVTREWQWAVKWSVMYGGTWNVA